MFGSKKDKSHFDYGLYAFYDTKAQAYRLPMPEKDASIIIRQVEKLFFDPTQNGNDLVTHAEDFALFKLGDYYSMSGHIEPCTPEHVVNLVELRARAHASMAAQSKVQDLRALPST